MNHKKGLKISVPTCSSQFGHFKIVILNFWQANQQILLRFCNEALTMFNMCVHDT